VRRLVKDNLEQSFPAAQGVARRPDSAATGAFAPREKIVAGLGVGIMAHSRLTSRRSRSEEIVMSNPDEGRSHGASDFDRVLTSDDPRRAALQVFAARLSP